jgi:acyl CoA:acetate/3-ketoacid CoA transferase alpha subunit
MDKLRSLHDAVAFEVRDGMSIAMGCALESLIPFAVSHEIMRQKKRNLSLIDPISDMQFDQMIGAGCVRKIIASWFGNVAAGLGHNYRRAAEQAIPGPIEIEEDSNFTIGLGLQAAAMGVPYLPTRTICGSDFAGGVSSGALSVYRRKITGRARLDTRSNHTSCSTRRSPRQRSCLGQFWRHARSRAGGEKGAFDLRRNCRSRNHTERPESHDNPRVRGLERGARSPRFFSIANSRLRAPRR